MTNYISIIYLFVNLFFINQSVNFPQPHQSQSFLLSFSTNTPYIHSLFLLFRKVQAFHVHQPVREYQPAAKLGTSSSIKAGEGNPAGGKSSRSRQQSQISHPPTPVAAQEDQASQLWLVCKGPELPTLVFRNQQSSEKLGLIKGVQCIINSCNTFM